MGVLQYFPQWNATYSLWVRLPESIQKGEFSFTQKRKASSQDLLTRKVIPRLAAFALSSAAFLEGLGRLSKGSGTVLVLPFVWVFKGYSKTTQLYEKAIGDLRLARERLLFSRSLLIALCAPLRVLQPVKEGFDSELKKQLSDHLENQPMDKLEGMLDAIVNKYPDDPIYRYKSSWTLLTNINRLIDESKETPKVSVEKIVHALQEVEKSKALFSKAKPPPNFPYLHLQEMLEKLVYKSRTEKGAYTYDDFERVLKEVLRLFGGKEGTLGKKAIVVDLLKDLLAEMEHCTEFPSLSNTTTLLLGLLAIHRSYKGEERSLCSCSSLAKHMEKFLEAAHDEYQKQFSPLEYMGIVDEVRKAFPDFSADHISMKQFKKNMGE